jgi:hypothetical protein
MRYTTRMAIHTKRPFDTIMAFRAGARLVDLVRIAAAQNEMSQSEFVRAAVAKEARRVLRKQNQIGEQTGPQPA